jgi:uncharacterized damage-inducible protein DinB
MIDQFRKNFEYDFWATQEMIKALEEMPTPPEKAVKIVGHISFAKNAWLTRNLGEDLSKITDPWPPYSLGEAKVVLEDLNAKWKKYLGSLSDPDLEKTCSFKTTQGVAYEQVIQDILVHLVDHGTYHRGQLATLIHQGGGKRPNVGYIGFVRILNQKKP